MKKLFSFLMIALVGFLVVSCTSDSRDDSTDNDTYPLVYDLTASFQSVNGKYVISKSFNAIPSTDVILVYRKSGVDGGNAVWQQIPRSFIFSDGGQLNYDFDFTRQDFAIYADGNIDFAAQDAAFKNSYLNNQTFRVVFVPAAATGRANVDYSNYEEVIKYYNINDSKVGKL